MAWERGTPKKLIGEDTQAYFNEVAAELEELHRTREMRERKYAEQTKELAARTYFLAVRHMLGRNGDPVEIETCDSLPGIGHMRATGRDYDHAVSNLRWGIAHELQKRGMVDDWEDAREAAVERFSFLPSMADSFGVKL